MKLNRPAKSCQEILGKATDQDWFYRFEIAPGSGVFAPGRNDVGDFAFRREFVGLSAETVAGKRVIDIGAKNGAFSFFLRDLGAEVLAVDVFDPATNGFDLVNGLRKDTVPYLRCSVYDLDPAQIGTFDIVAFYGGYHHLRHPLLAFERCNVVCKEGGMLLGGGTGMDEWFHDEDPSCRRGVNPEAITWERIGDNDTLGVLTLNDLPLCGFATDQFLRDRANWFVPNLACLEGWILSCGFKIDKSFKAQGKVDRPWNRDGTIRRATHNFVATKVGAPAPEYDKPTMQSFTIPTAMEVGNLRKKISRLEKEVKRLKG